MWLLVVCIIVGMMYSVLMWFMVVWSVSAVRMMMFDWFMSDCDMVVVVMLGVLRMMWLIDVVMSASRFVLVWLVMRCCSSLGLCLGSSIDSLFIVSMVWTMLLRLVLFLSILVRLGFLGRLSHCIIGDGCTSISSEFLRLVRFVVSESDTAVFLVLVIDIIWIMLGEL